MTINFPMHPTSPSRCVTFVLALAASWSVATTAVACPFCTVESRTLTEEITSADAVVLAKLVSEAPPLDMSADNAGGFGPADPDSGKATFRVVEVLHGADHVATDNQIKVVYFGEDDRAGTFFITGVGTEAIEWTTPLPLSAAAVDYVRELPTVAPAGADRLAFFQEYLENDDPLLAQDAYDEFARAPYSEVKDLKDRMHHDRLVAWIADPAVNPSRRRLYLTMLGVCGGADDLPMLEDLISSDFNKLEPILDQSVACGLALGGPIGLTAVPDVVEQNERRKKLGLDAAIACYLTLRGPDGLDLIDERFLKDPNVEYAQGYSTIMALRFLGEESEIVPRERLLKSMRLLLGNEDFADQVILDLSRWEDWSVLDQLAEMFKASDAKSYVRQPVVTYLTVASEQPGDVGPRATAALAELEALDPDSVKRARSMMAFGYLARARSGTNSTDGATGGQETTSELPPAGFAATADELEEAENASPEDFPDPASFTDAAGELSEPVSDVGEDSAPPKATAVTPPVEVFSRPLVIGVPLAAAAILVVVYWLILRIGMA
jgi:hypothetical protein